MLDFRLGLVRGTPLAPQGSPKAGKLLLGLRIRQGLQCSWFKALQDGCGCRPTLPGAAGGSGEPLEGPGEPLEGFGIPRGTSPAGVGCPEPHAKNVAMGCSVNVFKMKKGRLNPNY